jgi:hypothetical protein
MNESGKKYLRVIFPVEMTPDQPKAPGIQIDVYAVLEAFNVTCSARQHAIKKLLCAGLRGKNEELTDIEDARDAVDRAVELQNRRESDYQLEFDKALLETFALSEESQVKQQSKEDETCSMFRDYE